ncbi:hypothetical protein ACFWPK_04275 [Nocardia sp. NPDC058519]|uniref:hypothetical protein n=1 Tax=Nocardia sp. NPDC058519 TaxID=3346535 RepID=UPI00365773FD
MTTIGEYFAATRIRGINEGIGQDGVVQSFVGTPADGTLELPTGSAGPQGPQGPEANRFRWEGDVSDPVALTALAERLGPAHAGKAWRVESTNTLMYWNGQSFDTFAEAFGGHGPTGEPNTLTLGSVTTGAVGADLEITITGTSPAQTLDVVIPRGVAGRKGPLGAPGPLRSAPDYDDTSPPVNRAVPLWDPDVSKWKPTPYPGWRGPWTVHEGAAWNGAAGFATTQSGTGTTPNTICNITIPAQDVAWRPMVTGGCFVRTAATDASNRVDIEARITNAAGQIVAYGPGFSFGMDWLAKLGPMFETPSMTPASSVGVIAAGVPAVIAIVLRRNLGGGNYTYYQGGAHISVWAAPVTGAP